MVFSCLPPPPPEMYVFIFNEKHNPGAILGLGPGKQGKMVGLVGGGKRGGCACTAAAGFEDQPPPLHGGCAVRGTPGSAVPAAPWEAEPRLSLP